MSAFQGNAFQNNAFQGGEEGAHSFVVDAVIHRPDQPGSFTLDADLQHGFDIDAIKLETFAVDGLFDRAFFDPAYFDTAYFIKAVVYKLQTGSFTVDAEIVSRVRLYQLPVEVVVDPTTPEVRFYHLPVEVVHRTHTVVSDDFTLDAEIAEVGALAIFVAAIILAEQSDDFTIDAVVLAHQTGSFTVDAWIACTFTLNALVLRTQSGNFSVDALVLAHQANSFTVDAVVLRTMSGSFVLDAVVLRTITPAGFLLDAELVTSQAVTASFSVDAFVRLTFTLDAEIAYVGQAVWTTPVNFVSILPTEPLAFTIPSAVGTLHFWMEIDTVATFDSGNLRRHISHLELAGWEYWNGSAWTAVPQAGVPNTFAGNEARYTVQTPLTVGTWYRRVRAGTY